MRNIYLVATVLAAFLFCTSCIKHNVSETEDDLFAEMVISSQHYKSLLNDSNFLTKSAGSLDTYEGDIDITLLDDKFLDYIDLYTQPDDVEQWDEKCVLASISADSNFNQEEKVVFAQSIAFAYYVKTTDYIVKTKADASKYQDCVDQANKAIKRAVKKALITLACGIFEPTIACEAVAVINYIDDVVNANRDFEECINRAKN